MEDPFGNISKISDPPKGEWNQNIQINNDPQSIVEEPKPM